MFRNSVQVNPQRIAREIASQRQGSQMVQSAQQPSMARDRQFVRKQKQIQDIDRQIVDHGRKAYAEIANAQYRC